MVKQRQYTRTNIKRYFIKDEFTIRLKPLMRIFRNKLTLSGIE
jgi:hypothetical protein